MKGITEFRNFYSIIQEISRPPVYLVLVLVPFHKPKAMATRANSAVQWKCTSKAKRLVPRIHC